MAGSASDWLENAALDHILGRATTELSTGANANVYIALWNSTMNDTFTAASTGECAGSTYFPRTLVANSSANWTNSTGGSKHNKTTITVTTSAGADWGTINSVAIIDTTSTAAGNILWWADLAVPQVISAGNTVQFTTGDLVITLT